MSIIPLLLRYLISESLPPYLLLLFVCISFKMLAGGLIGSCIIVLTALVMLEREPDKVGGFLFCSVYFEGVGAIFIEDEHL